MIDPKISIGIDNCFAIKRWVSPSEWARVIKEMGMKYVEGVGDLEIEPLLTPMSWHDDWINEVNEQKAKHGVEVIMMYSNDSTYDTIGFAHPDKRIRDHYVEKWFDEFCRISSKIGANVGYYVQAIAEEQLFNKDKYDKAIADSFDCMKRVGEIAQSYGVDKVALEEMYTAHQPPFTIESMKSLMKKVNKESSMPLYVTEDVGHHSPNYLKPTDEMIEKGYMRYLKDKYIPVWLGSLKAQQLFKDDAAKGFDKIRKETVKEILLDVEENSHLFCEEKDTDCYEWLRELGAYSPVVHLQQTDGKHSSHDPFSEEANKTGIIHPVKILRAIKESYDKPDDPTMPKKCDSICLVQELYLSTKDVGYQGLWKLGWSTDYLRHFIPKDNMTLSELLEYNKNVIC